jgi:hypothetical protein
MCRLFTFSELDLERQEHSRHSRQYLQMKVPFAQFQCSNPRSYDNPKQKWRTVQLKTVLQIHYHYTLTSLQVKSETKGAVGMCSVSNRGIKVPIGRNKQGRKSW